MGFMGKIARIDTAMQRGLDNSFARVFGGRIVPAEIEELLKQETEDNLVRTYEGGIEAPNVFRVQVSTKDMANLSAEYPDLPAQFADQLGRFSRNSGWITPGPLSVSIEVDPALRTGQMHVRSSAKPNADGVCGYLGTPEEQEKGEEMGVDKQEQEQPAQGEATVSLLLQDGSSRTYMLHEGSNIIGRSNDVDFRLPDTGVSRQHAEITFNGQEAILVDLKSTNGTTVNDTPIDNWLLADGDIITVGHSNIEVRIVDPDSVRR